MTTLTVQPPSIDTILEQADPTGNYGNLEKLEVRSRNSSRNARSILEFSISAIPAGAAITSATLSLFDSFTQSSLGRTYWAYKLIRTDWLELQATWNVYKTGNSWTLAGGDYVTSNPAGGSATVPASLNWMDFNVLAIVQDAHDSSIDVEILVKDATESSDSTTRKVDFYSRTGSGGDTSLRPKLVIVYTFTDPTVTIQAITNIVTTTARGHGNVTSLGDATINQHGHVLRIGAEPDVDNFDVKTSLGTKTAIGTFISELTGLTIGQTYRVRAYVTSDVGTDSYSSELSFVAGTASSGGQSYPTQAITRVTNHIHKYNRKEGIFTSELALGEVTSDFGLPEWLSRPRASIPDTDRQRDIKEMADSPQIRKSIQEAIDTELKKHPGFTREVESTMSPAVGLPEAEPFTGATAKVTAPFQMPTISPFPPSTIRPTTEPRLSPFREWIKAGRPGPYSEWLRRNR